MRVQQYTYNIYLWTRLCWIWASDVGNPDDTMTQTPPPCEAPTSSRLRLGAAADAGGPKLSSARPAAARTSAPASKSRHRATDRTLCAAAAARAPRQDAFLGGGNSRARSAPPPREIMQSHRKPSASKLVGSRARPEGHPMFRRAWHVASGQPHVHFDAKDDR